MPTIYLHVGPHKTGSTYLQDIFTSQSNLLKKQGIEYPSTGREYGFGHHNIAWLFAEKPLISVKHAELVSELSRFADDGKTNALFSSEEFSKIPASKLKDLRRKFSKWNFHVLYFQRKGSAFIVSLWQESVKNGLTSSLNEMTLSTLMNNQTYNPFAHEENIAKFEYCLKGTTSAFDYNQLIEEGTNLIQPLSETMKVGLRPSNKKINPSLAMETIELIRAANLYNASIGRRRRGFPRIASLRILRIPFFAGSLKTYIRRLFKEQCASLDAKKFLESGFQISDFLNGDTDRTYPYIPEHIFFDKLNKDNILPWRIIKKMIREK